MVYSQKFVVCILHNGVPLPELANGTVQLPFNSEYVIRLRNKNDRRAVAQIHIDGENVSGGGFVIPASGHIDVKRWESKDRAFKFVPLDSPEAVDFGKNGPNHDKSKGMVEVHFFLEKQVVAPPVQIHHHHHYPKPKPVTPYPYPWYSTKYPCHSGDSTLGFDEGETPSDYECYRNTSGISGSAQNSCGSTPLADHLERRTRTRTKTCSVNPPTPYKEIAKGGILHDSVPVEPKKLDDGCTVEGNTTGQSFHYVTLRTEDTPTVLKLFLQGFEAPIEVAKKKPSSLEKENEELRLKIAELENEKLKQKIKELEEAKS